jgi:hypothetical protein
LNGVWCSSFKYFTLSNDSSNLDNKEVSEYYFISNPLNFVGPVSENIPKVNATSVLILFSVMETYLFTFSSVVRK